MSKLLTCKTVSLLYMGVGSNPGRSCCLLSKQNLYCSNHHWPNGLFTWCHVDSPSCFFSGTGVGEFSGPLRGHQTFRSSEKRHPAFNVHTQGASTKFEDVDWIQYVVIFMDISWVFHDKFDSLGSYRIL